MFIKHRKVSDAEDDGDASHVQGADWNDDHVLGHTAIVPLGIVVVDYDAVTEALDVATSSYRVSSVSLGAGHPLSISMDLADVPTHEEASVGILTTISVLGAQPDGHVAFAQVSATEGLVEVHLRDADGDPVPRFSASCAIHVTIYAEILLLN